MTTTAAQVTAPPASRRLRPRTRLRRKLLEHTWVLGLAPLALMVASDYKVRTRDKTAAIGGAADLFVLIELAAYGLVAVLLLLGVASAPGTRRRSDVILALAWAFAGFMALSAVYSPYPQLAMARGGQLLVVMSLATVLSRYAGRRHLHLFVHGFLVLVTLSVVFGKIKPYPSLTRLEGRFTWLYVHPVIAGAYLGCAVVVAVCYLVSHRRGSEQHLWPKGAYIAVLLVATFGLISSQTRGATAATLVAVVAGGLLAASADRRTSVVTIGVAVIAGAAVLGQEAVGRYAARGESVDQLATLNSRTELWELAFAAVRERPWGGFGLTASRGIFFDEIGLGGGHNALVNVLVDGGSVGTLLWLALLVALAARSLRLLRRHSEALRVDIAIVLSVLAFFIGDSVTTEGLAAPANVANIWLAVLVGWTGVLARHARRDAAGSRHDHARSD